MDVSQLNPYKKTVKIVSFRISKAEKSRQGQVNGKKFKEEVVTIKQKDGVHAPSCRDLSINIKVNLRRQKPGSVMVWVVVSSDGRQISIGLHW